MSVKFNWGHGILIFFGIFLSLAAVFIVFAFRHKNDLVTNNYYEKGANYSEQMAIDKRSVVFKDSIVILRQEQHIVFNFSPYLLSNSDTLSVHFFRPSDKKLDYHMQLPLTDSVFSLDKNILATGRYEVKMQWQMQGESYFLKKDLQVK